MRCDLYVDHYCRDFPHLFNLVHDKNVCIPQGGWTIYAIGLDNSKLFSAVVLTPFDTHS